MAAQRLPELQSFAVADGINVARPTWADNSFLIGYEEIELNADPFMATLAYPTDDNHMS